MLGVAQVLSSPTVTGLKVSAEGQADQTEEYMPARAVIKVSKVHRLPGEIVPFLGWLGVDESGPVSFLLVSSFGALSSVLTASPG